jgi:hypothetical protein
MKEYERGAFSLLLIIIIGLLVVGGYYYFKPSSKNETVNKEIKKEENKIFNKNEYEDWQEYINEKYNYKIKYPQNWYFVKEGYSPPPPTTVLFSDQERGYLDGKDYLFIEISMDLKLDRTLDTIGEVTNLIEQGYKSEKINFAGVDAVYLHDEENMEKGKVDSIYFIQGENIYRINYGGDTLNMKVKNINILKEIINTFSFLK